MENILRENQYKQSSLMLADKKDFCFNLMR